MKNIIHINQKNGCEVDMVYSLNDNSSQLLLEISANIDQDPKLQIGTMTFPLDIENEIDIEPDFLLGSGNFIFKITDTTGEYLFTIKQTPVLNATTVIKKINNFNYELKYYHESKTTEQLSVEVENIKTNYYTLTGGIKIPRGADLNTYKTPGNYYCLYTADVSTLSNCPVTSAFTMKVEHSNGLNYPRQIIMGIDGVDNCLRWLNTDTNVWGNWRSYSFEDKLSTHTFSSSYLFRFGPMVTIMTRAWQVISELVIPYGFRPVYSSWSSAIINVVSKEITTGAIQFVTDGSVNVYKSNMTEIIANTNNILVNATWFTNDKI